MKTVLVMLLFVLVLLQVRLWAGPGSISDIARLENEIALQHDENTELEARNSVLMDEVSDLRNGLDSIEERARNELGLIRRGETFYLIVDKDPNAPQTSQPVAETEISVAPLPDVAPEPPPEIIEDDNPYLEIFRDEDAPPDQTESAELQDQPAGLTTGQ